MFEKLATELKEIRAKKKSLETREKEITKEIIEKSNCQQTTIFGEIRVALTDPYFTLSLNEERLKVQHPDIYNECLELIYVPSKTSINFVKAKKGE